MALLLMAPALAAQQTGTVTGQVTDARTGDPVGSVQVYITGADLGVLSQQNGRFLLQNVPAGTHTLTAERIGYRSATEEVTVGAGETVVQDFTISEEALQLDEVVVTGTPGGTERRALGNSLTNLEVGEVTEQVAIGNMQDLLSGRATGLQFTRLSGNVGTGSPIQIRGVGSFNLNTNPLIYVDGVRVNNSSRAGPQIGTSAGTPGESGGGEVNVLDDFNPEDIESIEVIKGPAAATLYGTEASAGVIQIITKRGDQGAAQFNLSVRQGSNFMTDPVGRLGQQWYCPASPTPPCEDGDGNRVDPQPYNMYEEANRYIDQGYFSWPTENLYQYGQSQQYNLDVRGGTESIRYFLSGNYENEDGVVWYNNDEAFRLRANVSVVFSENFTLDVSSGYVDGSTRFATPVVSDGGLWQDMVWSNGFFLDRVTPFDSPSANPRLGGFQEHLPADVANVEATRDYSRFTGSGTLNFTYGDWLTQRAVVGVDKGWDTNRNLFPLDPGIVPAHMTEYTDQWRPVYSQSATGEITYDRPITTNFSVDYATTAEFDMNESFGTATSFGLQYYIKEEERFGNTGIGFPSPLSTTVNQTPPSRATINFERIENKSLGLYVQEELSWNDRLFVTGAVRFDDNSAFGADFEATTYPKLSGTWVISEEGFWDVDAINSLRLRAAWGQAGRQPDIFAGADVYGVRPGPGGTSAITPQSPGNVGVGPEKSTELEMGFDFALLQDRISGEFTYFTQKNEDALLSVPIAPTLGFPGSRDENLGRIDNWGWEASIDSRVFEASGAAFDLRVSADHTDNEIKDLGAFEGTTAIRIGYPYPNQTITHWVAEAEWDEDGAYENAYGEGISARCDVGRSLAPEGAETPGRYGVVPSGELAPCQDLTATNMLLGRAFFPYTFTVSPTLSLFQNALQVFAMAEGKHGKWGTANDVQWGHIYNNNRASAWEDDPLWVAMDRQASFYGDNRSKGNFKADFWKLREVGARYRLPESMAARVGAERATLSVSGRNLWTIWQKQPEIFGGTVSDPEYGTPTVTGDGNFWNQPPLSSVHATIRVSF